MKDFFCRLFTPWKAGAQFDAPEATGYSIADIANQPYYLIAVGVMVLALLLSLVMIRIEKELPKEMRPK